jgi:hypothetical protein
MRQIVTDDFNRANASGAGALGANWTDVTDGFNIASNQAASRTAGNDNNDAYTGAGWTGGNDQYAEVTVIAASGQVGPTTRNDTVNENFYLASCEGSLGSSITHNLISSNNGTFSTIASFTGTINANDVVRCEAQGTTIRFLVNGVQKASTTNSAWTTNKPGIFAFGTGSTVDNFAAGDFANVLVGGGGLLLFGVGG